MKLTSFLVFLLIHASWVKIHAQSFDNPTIITIGDVAKNYGNQSQDIINSYNQLIGADRLSALQAVGSLSSKGAHSALALALPLVDANVKPSIVDALSKVSKKDSLIVSSVLSELKSENSVIIEQGGEEIAGQHIMKQKLVKILTKQTGVDGSQVDVDNRQQINSFIADVYAANY